MITISFLKSPCRGECVSNEELMASSLEVAIVSGGGEESIVERDIATRRER